MALYRASLAIALTAAVIVYEMKGTPQLPKAPLRLVLAVFALIDDHGLAIMVSVEKPAVVPAVGILWVMTALLDDNFFFSRSWRSDWCHEAKHGQGT
jgi:hypothetical protein